MSPNTKTALIACAAAAAQTLPEEAAQVTGAFYLSGDAAAGSPLTGTSLTPVAAAPAADEIQFTGTPGAPSDTVTLSAAATADVLLMVTYVPPGALGAAA